MSGTEVRNPGVLDVIVWVFRGADTESMDKMRGGKGLNVLTWVGLLFFVAAAVLLCLGGMLWFPFYEGSGFLITLPLIPLLIFVAILLFSFVFFRISGTNEAGFAHALFSGGLVALLLCLGLAVLLLGLELLRNDTEPGIVMLTAFVLGPAWATVKLDHCWGAFSGKRKGLAAALSVWVALLVGVGLWYLLLGQDLIEWNYMELL
ncbi:MAG: hypothetical protein AAF570_27265 [Bacteroidota bacterium]